MMKKIQMTNLLGLDIYRILCCLGVLIYHVCDDYLVDNGNLFLWHSAAFCIPGFFLMSGYLIGIKESISLEYCENKILQNLKRLLGYVILWAIIFYILNNNFYNILDELEKGALSQGILPVSWFLFTWSFFMISAYPLKKLLEKHPILFISLSLLFMLSLEFRTTIFSKEILSTLGRTQSLWIDIYFPYFMFGMSLGKILSFKLQTTNYIYQ